MSCLTACSLRAHGGRRIGWLPLINWKGAREGSLGEGRVCPMHRHRCRSGGLYVSRNGGLSHRVKRGMATTQLRFRMVTHRGKRGRGLLPVHALMQRSVRVDDGRGRPIHRDELVEIPWSVRRPEPCVREDLGEEGIGLTTPSGCSPAQCSQEPVRLSSLQTSSSRLRKRKMSLE